MKQSRVLLALAFAAGLVGTVAAKDAPKPAGKPVAVKRTAAKTEDQKILDAYLKALSEKWGYAISLDDKNGLLIKGAGSESLKVGMADIKTEDDIEARVVEALKKAKAIEQHDSAAKVPVFYAAEGTSKIFKGAVIEADAAGDRDEHVRNAANDYKTGLNLKADKLLAAGGEVGFTADGKPVKRVIIRPAKEKGKLLATLDLNGYGYRRVEIADGQQSSDETKAAKSSAYYNYNEWLKKKAATADSKGGKGAAIGAGIDTGRTEQELKGALNGRIAETVGALPDAETNPDVAAIRASVAGAHVEQFKSGPNVVYKEPGAKLETATPIPLGANGRPDTAAASRQVADQLLTGNATGARVSAAAAAVKGQPAVPAVAKPSLKADLATGQADAGGAGEVAKGAGCESPGDIFRSDAERYKQHQKDAWADKAGDNIAGRKKAQGERDTAVGKINDECDAKSEEIKNDKANSEKGRAAKLSALAKQCQQRVDAEDLALSKKLEKFDIDKEAADKKKFNDKADDNLDSFYWQRIPAQIPSIQKSYLTPGTRSEGGAGQRDWLAQATGFGDSFKDKYTNAYFDKFWKGSAQADSVKACRKTLGDADPNQDNVDTKCVQANLAKWIHDTYYQKDDGAAGPEPGSGTQGPSEEELKKAREYTKKQFGKK